MSLSELIVSIHDWKTRRRMERAFRDTKPFGPLEIHDQRKHAAISALIGDRHYRRAIDVGCAEGALTRELARHCDSLVAMDISETAIWRSMTNLADIHNVKFVHGNVRSYLGEKGWDLIVLSDVLDHLDPGPRWDWGMQRLCRELATGLTPGGRLVLVSTFSKPGEFAAARRYEDLFLAGGLKIRREMISGAEFGQARFLAACFEQTLFSVPVTSGARVGDLARLLGLHKNH